jgi:hypothetical protein
MDTHTKLHYAGIALALGLSSTALMKSPDPSTLSVTHVVQRPGRADWAALGPEKTQALADALKGMKPVKVTIYCAQPHCNELKLDFDDAFQILGWQSDFEERMVESEADKGIFVGPPGPAAENMKAALAKIGLSATVVGITDENNQAIDGVGIIIGRK